MVLVGIRHILFEVTHHSFSLPLQSEAWIEGGLDKVLKYSFNHDTTKIFLLIAGKIS
jgi:hypothetical protein